MKVLRIILVIFVLVLAHEFGHAIAFQQQGLKVDEFNLGIGPAEEFLSWEAPQWFPAKRYGISLFLVGGSVVMSEDTKSQLDALSFSQRNATFTIGIMFHLVVLLIMLAAAYKSTIAKLACLLLALVIGLIVWLAPILTVPITIFLGIFFLVELLLVLVTDKSLGVKKYVVEPLWDNFQSPLMLTLVDFNLGMLALNSLPLGFSDGGRVAEAVIRLFSPELSQKYMIITLVPFATIFIFLLIRSIKREA